MTIGNLAAQLKQSIEKAGGFDSHPMQSADTEDKLYYLKALSLLFHADQTCIGPRPVKYFSYLVRTLNPADAHLDQLLDFAQDPDFSDIPNIKKSLQKQEQIGIAFLMDLTMLAKNAVGNVKENAVIAACRGLLGWDRAIFCSWFYVCLVVATEVDYIDGAFSECTSLLPTCCTDHVFQHLGIKRVAEGAAWSEWSKEALRKHILPQEAQLALFPEQSFVEGVAARIKVALETLAEFTSHPLQNAGLEDKMNYLKALSLVMAADEQIVPEEQAYFGAVGRTLINDDLLPELMAYAREPDLSETNAISETMAKSQDYQKALVMDAVVLACSDGEVKQSEQKLIEQLREIVRWDQAQLNIICGYAIALATEPEGVVLDALCRDLDPSLIRHILEYRGVATSGSTDIAAALKIDFEDIKDMCFGAVCNAQEISRSPVAIQQFVPFLQHLLYQQGLQITEGKLTMENAGELIDLTKNGLSIDNLDVSLEEAKKTDPIRSISPLAASMYCQWLSSFSSANYTIPQIKGDADQWVSKFTTCQKFMVEHDSKVKLFPDKTDSRYVKMKFQSPLEEHKICHGSKLYLVKTSASCHSQYDKTDRTSRFGHIDDHNSSSQADITDHFWGL